MSFYTEKSSTPTVDFIFFTQNFEQSPLNPTKETLTFKKEFFWQTTSGSLPAGLIHSEPRVL